MSPFQTSEMGDTHVYLMRPVAPALISQYNELQNLHGNSAAGLPQKNLQCEWTDIMVWQYGWHGFQKCIINNATDDWRKRL